MQGNVHVNKAASRGLCHATRRPPCWFVQRQLRRQGRQPLACPHLLSLAAPLWCVVLPQGLHHDVHQLKHRDLRRHGKGRSPAQTPRPAAAWKSVVLPQGLHHDVHQLIHRDLRRHGKVLCCRRASTTTFTSSNTATCGGMEKCCAAAGPSPRRSPAQTPRPAAAWKRRGCAAAAAAAPGVDPPPRPPCSGQDSSTSVGARTRTASLTPARQLGDPPPLAAHALLPPRSAWPPAP